MKFITALLLLVLGFIASTSSKSVHKLEGKTLHRSRRELIKATHKIWLSRLKRNLSPNELVALRKKITRVRRSLATGPENVITVELKFKRDWMKALTDHKSAQYQLMEANFLDAFFSELIADDDYIEAKVKALKKSSDKHPYVLGDIELHYDKLEEDPIQHLREIVLEKHHISSEEVSPDYFVILDEGNEKNATKQEDQPDHLSDEAKPKKPFLGPKQEFEFDIRLRLPWDDRYNDYNSDTEKNLETHIRDLAKIIFKKSFKNFNNDRVAAISDGPDHNTFARLVLVLEPGNDADAVNAKMLQLVKSGMLGDIPIFDDYLNGYLPGKEPTTNPSAAYQPEAHPTRNVVPEKPEDQSPTAPAGTTQEAQPTQPVPSPSQQQQDQTKYLNGSVKLDKTWYPFIGDVSGATHQILSHDIAEAIKDAYGTSMPVGVIIDNLGPTPDNKIQATYRIAFPSSTEPTLKPVDDAIGHGYLGGLPVSAGILNKMADDQPQAPAAYPSPAPAAYPSPAPAAYPSPAPAAYQAPASAAYPSPAPAAYPAPAVAAYPAPAPGPTMAPTVAPYQPTAAPTTAQYNNGQSQQYAAPTNPPTTSAPAYPSPTTTTATYHPPVVALPQGIPQSCEAIRNAGIGTKDGEYVLSARENCHLNIICQNMEDTHPKEYLGGPSQKQWMYWHYATLIKLSSHDKENIDQRACLESTAVGRQFIDKVMAAGGRQGNPLKPWKTNIKRMILSYVRGHKKRRRSMEGQDISYSTKAIRIYKGYNS